MNQRIEQHEIDQLSAYLDGELSPGERGELEQQLEARPQLAAELEKLRRLDGLLGVYNAPAPSGALRGQILRAAWSQPRRPAVLRMAPWAAAAAVAAAIVLAVVLGLGPGQDQPGQLAGGGGNASNAPVVELGGPSDEIVSERLAQVAREDQFVVEHLGFFTNYDLAQDLVEADIDAETMAALDQLERGRDELR
jgi:negative regulator of sigma E activity